MRTLVHTLVHMQLWDNPEKPETQWYIKVVAPRIYNIINVKTGKAINVAFADKHTGVCVCVCVCACVCVCVHT